MERKEYLSGLVYGASAFVIWGLLPFYWKVLSDLPPYQIIAQRAVWCLLTVGIILAVRKELGVFIKLLGNPVNWLNNLGPAVFITINWVVFIWGVNNGYVLEASLGYYINPLVLTVFGAVFFHERMGRLEAIGLMLAVVGVVVKTVIYGKLPLIALTLAISFGIYGLLKKKSGLSSLMGLGFETLIISIPSIFYLFFVETGGTGITGNLPPTYWLLIATTGFVTATPLLLYAEGTKRLPLRVVGFLQYIGPTLMLFLGVFVFGEAFDIGSWISFGAIWAGLIVFSYAQYRILARR